MRWYVITLLLIAFLVGSLFQASEQTGMRIWNMFATMGVFLFGVVGSLALARMQQRSGLKQVEQVIKALEPEWVITDWAGESVDRPDYLLVGPGGVAAITVDQTSGATFAWRAGQLIGRSRRRAYHAAAWVRERLLADPERYPSGAIRVEPILLLARCKVRTEYSGGGVTVLNPEQLAGHLRSAMGGRPQGGETLDQQARFQLTQLLRDSVREARGETGGEIRGSLH